MGRKKRSCIYEFYDYDEDAATSKCLIEGCSTKIKGKHGANLLRHFQFKHKQEYERILESNKENFGSAESEGNAIARNTEILKKNLIALVTVHGRPFSLLDDEAFQNIISLIPRVDKSAFTAQRIRELVEEMAYKLQQPEAMVQGPWGNNSFEDTSHSDSDSVDSNISETGPNEEYLEITEKKKRKRNKCRCCAEFTKDSVDVTDKPYLTRNKIALTLNDVSIEMDFNDDTPKTLCRVCDGKLQVMFDFMKQVKEAQGPRDNVIKPQDPRIGDNVKKKVEYIVVKTEFESADNEVNDIGCNDIIDPLTRAEIIKPIINKRKPVEVTIKTQKRTRVTGDVGENMIVDIQEETAEMVDPETSTKSSDLDLRRLLMNSILNE